MERGCTHFTHWFQPLTGSTAEKHDSFYNPTGDGNALAEFSGKELIQGEPDASSFPTGGIRATFEARGYTAWDPSSPAFILENPNGALLCIPTAFASWTGEALDHKIPLLRSMDALSRSALRALKLLGNEDATRVFTTIGPEQEYFLIDEQLLLRAPRPRHHRPHAVRRQAAEGPRARRPLLRLDPGARARLHARGRARDGASSASRSRRATTRSRRRQYEFAPVFENSNVGSDHQQLCMQILQNVARRYGLVCLLHEKPFAGVNGSGKHNNWSFGTDTGVNLLEPGDTPHENLQFLFFCTRGAHARSNKHQELLRASIASPGQDHRLGANEAPPAIISIFLGAELQKVYDAIESGSGDAATPSSYLKLGASVLPHLPMHGGDRNRTSPFAFTGNKFEFRALGSSMSCGLPNTVLNTIAAQAIDQLSDALEAQLAGGAERRRGGAGRRQGRLRREQADRLQRRQLHRGLARRGRGARAVEPAADAGRAARADLGVGDRGHGRLRRALRARAGVALRGVRRAVRGEAEHRGARRRSRWPRRCCCPRRSATSASSALAGDVGRRRRRSARRSPGCVDAFVERIAALGEANANHPEGDVLDAAQVRAGTPSCRRWTACARWPTSSSRSCRTRSGRCRSTRRSCSSSSGSGESYAGDEGPARTAGPSSCSPACLGCGDHGQAHEEAAARPPVLPEKLQHSLEHKRTEATACRAAVRRASRTAAREPRTARVARQPALRRARSD